MIIIGVICIGCLIYSVIAVVGVGTGAAISHHHKTHPNKYIQQARTLNEQTAQIRYHNALKKNILLHRKLRRIQNQNR